MGRIPEGSTVSRLNDPLCKDVSQVVVGYVIMRVVKTVTNHDEGTTEAILGISAIEPVGGDEAANIIQRIKEVAEEATTGQTVPYEDLDFDAMEIETIVNPDGTTISFDKGTGGMIASSREAAAQERRELLAEAVLLVTAKGYGSTSMMQRTFRIGHVKAVDMMHALEERGVVGPEQGTKPREVLISPEDGERLKAEILAEGEPDSDSPKPGDPDFLRRGTGLHLAPKPEPEDDETDEEES